MAVSTRHGGGTRTTTAPRGSITCPWSAATEQGQS